MSRVGWVVGGVQPDPAVVADGDVSFLASRDPKLLTNGLGIMWWSQRLVINFQTTQPISRSYNILLTTSFSPAPTMATLKNNVSI